LIQTPKFCLIVEQAVGKAVVNGKFPELVELFEIDAQLLKIKLARRAVEGDILAS
jgi:hypothetical protein